MISLHYPTEFERKVIETETTGGVPASVSIVIPTITKPSIPFDMKVVILDDNSVPIITQDRIQLVFKADKMQPISITFEQNQMAIVVAKGIVLEEEGFFRFETSFNEVTFCSNPTYCTKEPKHMIYWGDPHVHTILSKCHPEKCRTLNFCYVCGKHISNFDWIAAADHVSNNRCDFAKWKEQTLVSTQYNVENEFVTLPAYEASFKGGAGGDNNVYMNKPISMFADDYEEGSVKTLCTELEGKAGAENIDFFVVPHHTSRAQKHGEIGDDIYPGSLRMPVIEIASKWGSSEYRGNPISLMHTHDGPAYVQDFLNKGYLLGFVGGSDSHQSMTFIKDEDNDHLYTFPGITAVCTNELTRDGIFNGIKNRNCYAATLERIFLDVNIEGVSSGEIIKINNLENPRKIIINVAAQSDITNVEIIRNGYCIFSSSVNDWNTSFEYLDEENISEKNLVSKYIGNFTYYYVRVTCSSGATAWSSPVWLLAE